MPPENKEISFAAREKASRARRRRRGRTRRTKVSRARLVLPSHRSLSRLVARYSLHVLRNAPPCVPRSGRPQSALFRDSPARSSARGLAMTGIHVGSRVSQEAGRQIALDAQDDGASDPPGTGANGRRREQRRVRIYGNVVESVAANKWKVEWDEPNFKADPNGVSVTVEFYNKIRRERAGTGRYVPSAAPAPARSRDLSSPSFPDLRHPCFF